jgi:hypothetical protein
MNDFKAAKTRALNLSWHFHLAHMENFYFALALLCPHRKTLP